MYCVFLFVIYLLIYVFSVIRLVITSLVYVFIDCVVMIYLLFID